jgi:Zn-dependent peptidase ImmA (M78 family)
LAKNRILRPKTTQDIDQRVERVLRGLGNPEPPLRLEDVRELLKLDRDFYTADDPSLVREAISRIRVASIQLYQRPTLIVDVIRKLSLKALYIPDRKRILLDGNLPQKKHRWSEAHEIGHSLIPWHDDMMLGDNEQTLSQDCHEQIEAEANFAAGRLLFLRDRFAEEACDMNRSIASVQSLHRRFGNTISTTLYRFVETTGVDLPVIGLITRHPHVSKQKPGEDQLPPCRHFIQSPSFSERFSRVTEDEIFRTISGYCGSQSGGPLGNAELILTDDNGDQHRFFFETFYNSYDALTLGVYLTPVVLMMAV